MKEVNIRAYGKINLGLDVLGVRDNGYHDVKMIMQTVGVYDDVTLHVTETPGITICTDAEGVPCNEQNLAYKAAKLLMEEFQIQSGVQITLKKQIPVAAGMAGGSSDCAAVLRGMNQLFSLGLTPQQLCRRGVTLGADVPYCIVGKTALSEGIGEILTELPAPPDAILVIAKPSVSVSTKEVYTDLDRTPILQHPDLDGLVQALEQRQLSALAAGLGNVLETVTIAKHPEIAQLKQWMLDAGALGALMSGSGPTVFGLFDRQELAEQAAKKVQEAGLAKKIFVTTFINQID